MVDESIIAATSQIVDGDRRGVVVTVLVGEDAGTGAVLDGSGVLVAGHLPGHLRDPIVDDALRLVDRERSITLGYDGVEVFFEMITPRPRLFIFGAVHIAQELTRHASLLGFSVVVADPRPAFVTAERFPEADELRVGWPGEVCSVDGLDERTFVVVLTHDRRFEDPLWPIALQSSARYLGAMGSRKTTSARRERLVAQGFSESQVDRIHGPIGLAIGSRTAGETAIAILAQIIGVRYRVDEPLNLSGTPLRP